MKKDDQDWNDQHELDEEDDMSILNTQQIQVLEQERKEKLFYVNSRVESDIPEQEKIIVGQLRVFAGGDVESDFIVPIKTGVTLVGSRAEHVQIHLNAPAVSAVHAIIDISNDGREQFIEDLDSTNGTSLGKSQYQLQKNKMYQLSHNKIIRFGPIKTQYFMKNSFLPLGDSDSEEEKDEPELPTSHEPNRVLARQSIIPQKHDDIVISETPTSPVLNVNEIAATQAKTIDSEKTQSIHNSNHVFTEPEPNPSREMTVATPRKEVDMDATQDIDLDEQHTTAELHISTESVAVEDSKKEIDGEKTPSVVDFNQNDNEDAETDIEENDQGAIDVNDPVIDGSESPKALDVVGDEDEAMSPVLELSQQHVAEIEDDIVLPPAAVTDDVYDLKDAAEEPHRDNMDIDKSEQVEVDQPHEEVVEDTNPEKNDDLDPAPDVMEHGKVESLPKDNTRDQTPDLDPIEAEAESKESSPSPPTKLVYGKRKATKVSNKKATKQLESGKVIEKEDTDDELPPLDQVLNDPVLAGSSQQDKRTMDQDNVEKDVEADKMEISEEASTPSHVTEDIAEAETEEPVAAPKGKRKRAPATKKKGKAKTVKEELPVEEEEHDVSKEGEPAGEEEEQRPVPAIKRQKRDTKKAKQEEEQDEEPGTPPEPLTPNISQPTKKTAKGKTARRTSGGSRTGKQNRKDDQVEGHDEGEDANVAKNDESGSDKPHAGSVKADAEYRILFTGIPDWDVSLRTETVEGLGGVVVQDWQNCTHVVTDKCRRTVKFLCAFATGKYIMDVKWLDASNKSGKFVAEGKYLLKDTASEKDYGFKVKKSLTQAQEHPGKLFEGRVFYATESVKPPQNHLSEILSATGGRLEKKLGPNALEENWIIIGSADDVGQCNKLAGDGFDLHTNEFILSGILRQEVDFKSHRLQLSHTPSRAVKRR